MLGADILSDDAAPNDHRRDVRERTLVHGAMRNHSGDSRTLVAYSLSAGW
jgi:hypothetical protein